MQDYEIKLEHQSRCVLTHLCIKLLRNMDCPFTGKVKNNNCGIFDCCTSCKLEYIETL